MFSAVVTEPYSAWLQTWAKKEKRENETSGEGDDVIAVFQLQTAVIATIGFPSTTASTAELGACCRTTRSHLPILGIGLESHGKEYARSLGSLG